MKSIEPSVVNKVHKNLLIALREEIATEQKTDSSNFDLIWIDLEEIKRIRNKISLGKDLTDQEVCFVSNLVK